MHQYKRAPSRYAERPGPSAVKRFFPLIFRGVRGIIKSNEIARSRQDSERKNALSFGLLEVL